MNFIFFISLWILVFTFLAHSEEKQVNFKIIPNLSYSKGENPRQTLDLLIPDPKAVSLKKHFHLLFGSTEEDGGREIKRADYTHPVYQKLSKLVNISGLALIIDSVPRKFGRHRSRIVKLQSIGYARMQKNIQLIKIKLQYGVPRQEDI